MRSDRGTLEKTSELSSRPEEMIHYPYLTSNQSATNTTPESRTHSVMTLSYIICNLQAIGELRLVSVNILFSWMALFINKIANISPLKFLVFIVWLC